MANRWWVGSGGTWDAVTTTNWSATSGGAGGQSVPGASDTVTFDASSGGGTVTVGTGYNPSVTSITMGAFTGTLNFSAFNNSPTMQTFDCSGTGTRTLSLGSGTFTITGNNGNPLDVTTTTNLTNSANTATIDFTYSGSVGTRQIFPRLGSSIKISAGTDTVNLRNDNGFIIQNLDWTGFAGTWDNTTGTTYTMQGNLTLGSAMTIIGSGTNLMTWSHTSGTKTITSNGVVLSRSITVNGVGGTLSLADGLVLATSGVTNNTLTLTNGTFDANNKNVTCGIFSSSNSNTRVLTMGSGTWTITGNATTIFNVGTTTNLTMNFNTSTVDCTYSGSTGTRNITLGSSSASTLGQLYNFKVSAGSDSVLVTASGSVNINGNLDYTGFSGIATGFATGNFYGDFTLPSGMTATGQSSTITFKGTSGTSTITLNSVALNTPITIDGVGKTFILGSNLDMSGASQRTLTLTNGTFNANNKNVTCGTFSSSNSNTRTINMGSGTWQLTGTGTVWDTGTTTGLTLNANTSTVLVSNTSASTKTMTIGGAGTTFYNVAITGGTGSGTVNLFYTTNRNFNNISLLNSPTTLTFNSGSTTVAGSLSWTGTAGNLNSIISTSPGTPFTVSVASGTVSQNYISLKDSTATGGATFYAGANSTNVSGNTGWLFQGIPTLKYWNGSSWVAKVLKYFAGTTFQTKTLKYWNGSSWLS